MALPLPEPVEDSVEAMRREVRQRLAAGDRFAALIGSAVDGTPSDVRLTALLTRPGGIYAVDSVVSDGAAYRSLTPDVPAAFWYEREIHDMFGVVPRGHPRLDPLVLPLSDTAAPPRPGGAPVTANLEPDEAALPGHVSGHGLFTIPHGPVRSGVFESVEYLVETPGEDIPHVRVRVFAKHRGIEKCFEGLPALDGIVLAERVEGIASVAHALAYAHALEQLGNVDVPPAASLLRVVHAELERIANHLDVAVKLADAAGLAVAVARFGWHKERVLRLVGRLCGSRFGRGVVIPGGVRVWPANALDELRDELARLRTDISGDESVLMRTASFLDRLRGTGPLHDQIADRHGALGPVGRACGLRDDARLLRPYDGYRQLELPPVPAYDAGDAMARLRVRWAEVYQAFNLIGQALGELASLRPWGGTPPLAVDVAVPDGRGIGWAEAPQGEVVYLLEVAAGRIRRCRPRSASFHNLVLFHSVFAGDVLTDFPFIEASFGLSIAGVAL